MNPKCKCGGNFVSVDNYPSRYDATIGRTLYDTVRIQPGYASWQCNKCGKMQQQKLRTSKKG